MNNDAMESGLRLDYKKIFLLGFGFFIISMTWSIFNSYVPIFLKGFISSTWLVGLVMTFDNIAGLTFQPYFSARSDRTRSRFGRRLPFLMAGVPPAALFFLLLPGASTLLTLMVSVILVDLSMSVFRGPTVALMPDLTPSPLRSKANGIINFMGGLGALIAFFFGSSLYRMNHLYPFALVSILMVVVLILLLRVIREPEVGEKEERVGLAAAFMELVRSRDKSGLLILGAILFWFIGWSGAEAFFTLYAKFGLGIEESRGSFLLGFFSISFLIFAIPSGFIGTAIGRKRTIQIGVAGLAVILAVLSTVTRAGSISVLFLIGGLFWALININSYPMVVELAGKAKIGAYTGLYYFFSSLAAVVAPPTFGALMDRLGYGVLFVASSLSLAVAFIFISLTRKGDVAIIKL
ncbi:MAG: MFS transporter [Firmicutes bacterium]|nr:MFS transporter [Bacillota bacterium]